MSRRALSRRARVAVSLGLGAAVMLPIGVGAGSWSTSAYFTDAATATGGPLAKKALPLTLACSASLLSGSWTFSWNAVPNAAGYTLKVGTQTYQVSGTSLQVSTSAYALGTSFPVTVTAKLPLGTVASPSITVSRGLLGVPYCS